MSMKSKRKTVGKDDLRRLMKEQKNARTSKSSKIDSPYAKYNSLGQLSCSICKTQVKSDILWNAHVQGRTHKQTVTYLKNKSESINSQSLAVKRKAEPQPEHTASKQIKNEDNAGSGPKLLSLGLGEYSSSEEEEDEDVKPQADTKNSSLSADFFDSGVASSEPAVEKEKEVEVKPKLMSEVLPEGFFDNPKMDAKVRNVEYRDKMDDEWEQFQKEMKEETHVSEKIIAEEDEINTEERNIEEIDDQLLRWTKIDALGKKKDELMQQKKTEGDENSDSNSEADELEFEEFLDWRSKASMK